MGLANEKVDRTADDKRNDERDHEGKKPLEQVLYADVEERYYYDYYRGVDEEIYPFVFFCQYITRFPEYEIILYAPAANCKGKEVRKEKKDSR